jgi:tRNA-modifying protein YgfZ
MLESEDVSLLTRAAALVAGRERELVVATGGDRLRFLNGIVTGDVAGAPVGGGCHAALLTTKGHVVADLRIFVREEAAWIVVDAGQGEPTAAALSRYAIMDDFTAVREPRFALFAVLGPEAAARLAAVRLTAAQSLSAPLSHAAAPTPAGDVWVVRVRELGVDGFWVGGAPEAVAATRAALEAAGLPALSPSAAEAARLAALEPRWGAEITPDYFPMEVGLVDAIDYTKGCYLGQEPVVRLRDRGHINWRLVALDIVGARDPAPLDPLESDTKPRAGKLTSVGRFSDGRGVALAMLHVSIPVGAEVRIKPGADAAGEVILAQVRASVSDGKPSG